MTCLSSIRLKSLIILVLTLVASWTAGAGPADRRHAVRPQGSVDMSLTQPDVQVTLETIKIPNDFVYKDALLWGGDTGFLPASVVSAIRVRQGARKLFVPMSAYSDLGDVHSAALLPDPSGFILNLYGGETATTYKAQLRFANGYLLSRVVSSGEFPQNAREETRYSFPKDD